jgi:formylglycine-generating enzyme required for sulfatase activity
MKPAFFAVEQLENRRRGRWSWGWGCIFLATGALILSAARSPLVPETQLKSRERVAEKTSSDDEASIAWCEQDEAIPTMVRIPAGSYQPFYKAEAPSKSRWVDAFLLDARPVTRGEYLAFVTRRPVWRKTRVLPLFAERAYLNDWRTDLDPGDGSLEHPANYVSWFAAKAYCECHGKRLPTVSEWECAALAASRPKSAQDRRSAGGGPESPFQFAMGRRGPDVGSALEFAGVWEWTNDFNSVLISGRSDTGSGSSLFCGDGYRANDAQDYAGFLRHSFRASMKADYTLKNLGFRCAKDL